MPLLILWSLFYSMIPVPEGSSKVALIVSISQYCEDCGWNSLHADQDARVMEMTLLKQGFRKDHIFKLQNADATYTAILNAIENQLVSKAEKGGLAVFYFSGHGQQVQDDNGDEIDGLDEAIVPFDSPLYFQKGIYEGEKLIRDETLGKLLDKVRKKLGKKGHLLTILDSCHSGTGTRGMGSARGTDIVMADSSYLQSLERPVFSAESAFFEKEDPSRLASQVALFGSGAQQLNYEMYTPDGQAMGSLTYAFCQALSEHQHGQTYQALFDHIRLTMGKWVPRQQPQAEGALQMEILGGEMLEQQAYFRLTPGSIQNPKTVKLEAGKLQGLFPGTQLSFFPAGTYDRTKANPITAGRIIEADLLECRIELERAVSPDSLIDSWIYLTQQSYGKLRLPLQLNISDPQLKEAFIRECASFPVIQIVEQAPELILQIDQEQQELQAHTPDGLIPFREPLRLRSDILAGRMIRSLLGYLQAQFLRGLEMEDPALSVQAVLVPQQTQATPERGICRAGDTYRLEITNHGELPAYYNLLDIQPNHQLNILTPPAGSSRTYAEYYIQPGETQVYEQPLEIQDPFGLEILKVIASEEPINLRHVSNTRGQSDDYQHPLQQLLAATYSSDTRGEQELWLFPELNVYSLVFRIEPGK